MAKTPLDPEPAEHMLSQPSTRTYRGHTKLVYTPEPNRSEASMQESTPEAGPLAPQLTDIELRVLGALMEKELTTPDQYPLTLNSLISACNQKSSRDPVSAYANGEIARTLLELETRQYVQREYGSRVERYTQRFISQLQLGRKHQALLAVMMLRGPQTLSELSTRTQRMVNFIDKADLEHTVHRLCERNTPYAIRIAAAHGQRGDRFVHLFGNLPANHERVASAQQSTLAPSTLLPDTRDDAPEIEQAPTSDIKAQIDSLSEQVLTLEQQLTDLYRLTGHEQTSDTRGTR